EHLISARGGGLDLCVRVVAIWAANQAGEKSGFRQREIRDVLIEVSARSLTEAVDREPGLLAHVNLIAVELEDLFFTQPRLENDRHVCFADFASPGLLRREQEVLY